MARQMTTCGHCGTRFDDVRLPDHDCTPTCPWCGDEFERKADADAHQRECERREPTPAGQTVIDDAIAARRTRARHRRSELTRRWEETLGVRRPR